MPDTSARRVIVISTLVVIDRGRMLLVRKEGATAFILPGGKIEPGESLEQAVRREVREELGCDIVGLSYAATFRDAAADASDTEVVVHVHIGHLSTAPIIQAEIREMTWCSLEAPEVPVAPSLSRQIFGYFRGAAAINDRLVTAVEDLRRRVTMGEYADRHAYESVIGAEVALGEISSDEVPMRRIVLPMHDRNTSSLARKRRELTQMDDDIASRVRMAEKETHEGGQYRSHDLDYDVRLRAKREALVRDIARGQSLIDRLETDPASALLPLGTLVRVRPFETMPDDWPLPVAGTTGVVTGYSTTSGRPNVVSLPQDVRETNGDIVLFDEDEANRYHQTNYLLEDLETIAPGEIVDGTPVERPGWWPTHSHHEKGTILYSESMVVRSDGRLWRIQPCSLLPECTQITVDTPEGRARFDHLVPLS